MASLGNQPYILVRANDIKDRDEARMGFFWGQLEQIGWSTRMMS